MALKPTSCFGCLFYTALLVGVAFIIARIKDPGGEKAKEANEAAQKLASEEAAKFESEKPLGSLARAEHEIRAAMPGRPLMVTESNGDVTVEFEVGDNLTAGMIKSSAQSACATILQSIVKSQLTFTSIQIYANHELQDAFGQSTNTRVVSALYHRDTVAKIDWNNFLSTNVYRIADNLVIHPGFAM